MSSCVGREADREKGPFRAPSVYRGLADVGDINHFSALSLQPETPREPTARVIPTRPESFRGTSASLRDALRRFSASLTTPPVVVDDEKNVDDDECTSTTTRGATNYRPRESEPFRFTRRRYMTPTMAGLYRGAYVRTCHFRAVRVPV